MKDIRKSPEYVAELEEELEEVRAQLAQLREGNAWICPKCNRVLANFVSECPCSTPVYREYIISSASTLLDPPTEEK
jgi:rubrerythrin